MPQGGPHLRIEGEGIVIGDHVRVFGGCVLRGPCQIGSNAFLNEDVYVNHHATLADHLSVGQHVRFVTGTHEMARRCRASTRAVSRPLFCACVSCRAIRPAD